MKDLTYRITVQPIGPEESEISEELRGGGCLAAGS